MRPVEGLHRLDARYHLLGHHDIEHEAFELDGIGCFSEDREQFLSRLLVLISPAEVRGYELREVRQLSDNFTSDCHLLRTTPQNRLCGYNDFRHRFDPLSDARLGRREGLPQILPCLQQRSNAFLCLFQKEIAHTEHLTLLEAGFDLCQGACRMLHHPLQLAICFSHLQKVPAGQVHTHYRLDFLRSSGPADLKKAFQLFLHLWFVEHDGGTTLPQLDRYCVLDCLGDFSLSFVTNLCIFSLEIDTLLSINISAADDPVSLEENPMRHSIRVPEFPHRYRVDDSIGRHLAHNLWSIRVQFLFGLVGLNASDEVRFCRVDHGHKVTELLLELRSQ
mmetsp:Transcript_6630/g.16171  ORF Transcript_6630/g.16171 Transcript_6630/m.16171 type:complete len:334 (-) Transcript_6630:1863-2864(-)